MLQVYNNVHLVHRHVNNAQIHQPIAHNVFQGLTCLEIVVWQTVLLDTTRQQHLGVVNVQQIAHNAKIQQDIVHYV